MSCSCPALPRGFCLLSVPAPWHCHLPLPLWLLLLEGPAPCVFHMPSFDATALSAAYPPSLPPAPFSAAMAPVRHALSETEQYEGG